MAKTFTQERFDKEFGTEDFEVFIKCRKCGSDRVDLHFNPGHVYSEYTSDAGNVEVWCCDCKHTATKYG